MTLHRGEGQGAVRGAGGGFRSNVSYILEHWLCARPRAGIQRCRCELRKREISSFTHSSTAAIYRVSIMCQILLWILESVVIKPVPQLAWGRHGKKGEEMLPKRLIGMRVAKRLFNLPSMWDHKKAVMGDACLPNLVANGPAQGRRAEIGGSLARSSPHQTLDQPASFWVTA